MWVLTGLDLDATVERVFRVTLNIKTQTTLCAARIIFYLFNEGE
jgi:hypothetical protein